MANYNRVILMGNLTRDPQLRYLPSNMAVCDFGLAINRRFRDKEGNQRDETCFVDITAFGRQAETLNQYMTKGRPLLVEGRLRFDSWTGQDGQKRSKLTVVAETFQFVGAREGGGGGGAPARDQGGERGGYSRGEADAGRPGTGPDYGPSEGPPTGGYGGRNEPVQDYGPPDVEGPSPDDIPF